MADEPRKRLLDQIFGRRAALQNFRLALRGAPAGHQSDQRVALTVGNARTLTSGISTGFEMARPIFGREQLKYLF